MNAPSGTPPRSGFPRALAFRVLVMLLLGIAFLLTNPYFTVLDDEARIVSAAAQPVRHTVELFLSGAAQHEHPPLYDLVLHGWLRLTGGALPWLRFPSIVFHLAGLWILCSAAARLAGPEGAAAMLWIGALWPYGFHYGRIAAWYSFAFLLIAGLTHAYLRLCEAPTRRRWFALVIWAVLLLYTNYFAWALLACLALDFLLRRRPFAAADLARIAASFLLLSLLTLPVARAFLTELRQGMSAPYSWRTSFFAAAYNLYVAYVGESVAPWFWHLGVPVALALAAGLGITLLRATPSARRFLLYAFALLVLMCVSGLLVTKRMILLGPWLLLPLASAWTSVQRTRVRYVLAAAAAVVVMFAWGGIAGRRHYAAPRFLEPWPEVASLAAQQLDAHSAVVANNPSFFFYLTYALAVPPQNPPWRFQGMLPEDVRDPRVFDADQWFAAGRPTSSIVLWVRGMPGPAESGPMWEARGWLDTHCQPLASQFRMRDPGYEAKRRFAPEYDQLLWRVEIRHYACSVNSPEENGAGSRVPSAPER